MATTERAYERLGVKRLSLPDVIAQSVGFMGPVFAIFGSFYKVTSPTIWAPWLALALLAVGFVSIWVLWPRSAATTQLEDLTSKTPV